MLCGDFSCGSVSCSGTNDRQLAAILESYNLQQHVNAPTRGNALVDMVITSSASSMSVRHLGISDHYVVSTKIDVNWSRPLRVTYDRRNYGAIDVYEFRRQMSVSTLRLWQMPTRNSYATATPQYWTTRLHWKRLQNVVANQQWAGSAEKQSNQGVFDGAWNDDIQRQMLTGLHIALPVDQQTRSSMYHDASALARNSLKQLVIPVNVGLLWTQQRSE